MILKNSKVRYACYRFIADGTDIIIFTNGIEWNRQDEADSEEYDGTVWREIDISEVPISCIQNLSVQEIAKLKLYDSL